MPGVYRPKGPAEEGAAIRGLVSFPIRNRAELEARVKRMYDPADPDFRRYLTPSEWIAAHSPTEEDVRVVSDWLRAQGLEVPRVATNRLLIQFTGTVGQFNRAFGTEVIILERKSPQAGNDPHDVYGFTGKITVPKFVRERIHAVVALDLPAETDPLPNERGEPSTEYPENVEDALTPQQVAAAYGFDALHRRGFDGRGVRLGVTVGAHFRYKDLHAFWKIFGIERADPVVVQTMEPPSTRYRESQLDVAWAGAMAPGAELVVYMGPDARNTSMIFTFNEANARGEVSVITDSFAHREDSEPRAVHEAYDASALAGASMGITVLCASGDSAGVDVPASSPYVTAVGGTELVMRGNELVSEIAWWYSGSGLSRTFRMPEWQAGLEGLAGKRAVADVALNASTGYWYLFLGVLRPNTGTSFGSPIFGAMIASVNSARLSEGRPPVGWLNGTLYTRPEVQRTFRDVNVGYTDRGFSAGPGWDVPTGWGAPDAEGLLRTLP
jgi:kumamolisin